MFSKVVVLTGMAALCVAAPAKMHSMSEMSAMSTMDTMMSAHEEMEMGSMEMGMGMSSMEGSDDSMMETAHAMGNSMMGEVVSVEASPFDGMTCGSQFQNANEDFLQTLADACVSMMNNTMEEMIEDNMVEDLGYMTGVCEGHPATVIFSLTGNDCNTVTSYQENKFSCSETGALEGDVTITSDDTDLTFDAETGHYTMTGVGAQTDLTLTAGDATQMLSVHTSCSKDLESGYMFGGIEIVGFTYGSSGMGHGHGSMMMHSHGGSNAGGDGGCDCHPDGLQFQYIGGGCDQTTFDQSGKLECSGAAASGTATITCEGGLSVSTEEGGDYFQITNPGAQTDCTITSEGGTQELSIHTSCSGGLYAGDVYGAVQVVAWDCGDGYGMVEETGEMGMLNVLEMCAPSAFYLDACTTAAMEGVTGDDAAALRCFCGIVDLPEPMSLVDEVVPFPNENVTLPDLGPELSFFTCSAQECPGNMDGECGPDMMPSLVANGDCFEVTGGAPGCPMCVNFDGQSVCSDPMPSTCCPDSCAMHLGVVVRYVASCECHPDAMSFTYVGGGCGQSNNEQGGKFECSGGSPSGAATISCDSGDVYEDVSVGDVFVLGGSRLGAQTDCTITSGGETQMISVHTSCSQGLYSGDIFGAVKVTGWECDGSEMSDESEQDDEGVCDCHPECLEFSYAGNDCTSTHDQGGKLGCEGAVSGDVTIEGDTTVSTLSEGDVVGLGCMGDRLGAQSDVTLTDSEGNVQSLSLHTSCSQRLAVGDTYGALTVTGFSCSSGGGSGGSGTMSHSHSMSMMSHGEDGPQGTVLISFFADGMLVGDVAVVPADQGVMTCGDADAMVGVGDDGSMGNSDLYSVAVPDSMVPRIFETNECGVSLPGCIDIPTNLLDQFEYGTLAEGESCPDIVPLGMCTFNPICSFYETPLPAREGRPARQPFVPENCMICACGNDEVCPYESGEVDSMGRSLCGEGVNDCVPRPSDSRSPSPSPSPASPSPSPSVEPIYQMFVASNIGLCVSADDDDNSCVNESPYDEYTTRIQLMFERAIPAHNDAEGNTIQNQLYVPPVSEMIESTVDLSGITIYSRRGSEVTCWIRMDGNEYNDDVPHDENDIDFCANMADWVPTFLVGDDGTDYSPAVFPGGVWPNNLPIRNEPRDAWSMAVDCSALSEGPYAEESLAQSKIIFFPIGPEDGPCWNDPDYGGEQVCASGGVRGNHQNDVYRDINGDFYPFCSNDNDGPCPRYFAFNCPAGSKKSTATQKLDF